MNASILTLEADLSREDHAADTLRLLDAYSADPMGDGHPLSDAARRDLIPGLRQHPTTHVFLAYVDGEAVGIAICFLGFSTFAARLLLYIMVGRIALRPDVSPATRALAFAGALASVGYIVGVAVTRSPALGLL